MSEHKTLRLCRTGKVALVDAEDYPRVSQHEWLLKLEGYAYRPRTIAGRRHRLLLHREILQEPVGIIRFINGNGLDCRRANLRLCDGGSVSPDHTSLRPFRVRIDIEGEVYFVGGWPTRDEAEEVRKVVAAAARELRGRGLPRGQVRRRLDMAAGRARNWQGRARNWQTDGGAELTEQIRATLPASLSPDVREEAEQEIALAILDGRITPDQLREPNALRDHLRAAPRLTRLDHHKHISLDHELADGLRLIDVLAA